MRYLGSSSLSSTKNGQHLATHGLESRSAFLNSFVHKNADDIHVNPEYNDPIIIDKPIPYAGASLTDNVMPVTMPKKTHRLLTFTFALS